VQGFKGPPDRGNNGNFGFHEGFNIGGTFNSGCGIGYQFGGRFLQSDLSGDNAVVTRTANRDQHFFTAGLFRKAPCGYGLQGGVVWDHLHDDYYVDMDLTQIRGELSYLTPWCREFGFWFAASNDDDTGTLFTLQEVWEPTDLYAFFYRRHFGCSGQGRLWAGWTGEGDGLLGGELFMPLSNCWAVQTNFNYLIPEENGVDSIAEEAWSIGISLVWYAGGNSSCAPCRPLFTVADNATFMVDRVPQAQTVETAE
jgi:hypothetical protein